MISKIAYAYSLRIFKKNHTMISIDLLQKDFLKKKFNFNSVVTMDSSTMMDVHDEPIF